MKKTCEKNGFSSDFEEIGGNNGSFRAPISDRCPEGTSKTRESEGTAVLPIRVFFSSAPAGQREKKRESERKARFYSLCPAGAEEKNTRIGGDPFSLIPGPFSEKKRTGFSRTRVFFSEIFSRNQRFRGKNVP